MSALSALHKFVHDRFREVFGAPDNSLGRDDHWAIMPGPDQAPIHVLVNGAADRPAIWVFDPHSVADRVYRASIKDEDELYKVIKHIEHRVQRAAAMNASK